MADMDILIVKLGALGDVVRTTALLRPLRRRWPGCRICWVTSRAALPLLRGNELLDEAVAFAPGPAGRFPASADAGRGRSQALAAARPVRLAARISARRGCPAVPASVLRGRRYDLVLSMEESVPAASLAAQAVTPGGRLVGVTVSRGVLGYTRDSAPYYRMSLLNRDPGGGHAAADRLKAANRLTYARLWLKVLGLPEPPSPGGLAPVLRLGNADRSRALKRLRLAGLPPDRPAPIGVNTGAGRRWPAKQLSEERTAALLHALRPLGRPLLLLGGPDEARRNRRILRLAPPGVIAPGTDLGLREFAAVLGLCAVVVTADTLALHLAAAMGRRVVAFAGPTSAAELDLPAGGEVLLPRRPCSCFYRPRCRRETSCLDSIPPGRFAAAVRRQLA